MTKKILSYIHLLKPLSFIPALLIMCTIFSYSSQNGKASGNLSHTISYNIVKIGNYILQQDASEELIGIYAKKIEYPIRKLAHMTEYFILAIAIFFPLYLYGLRGFPLIVVTALICIGFAATDEYHQSFVSGRGPSVRDVGIDSIGVFGALIAIHILLNIYSKRKHDSSLF